MLAHIESQVAAFSDKEEALFKIDQCVPYASNSHVHVNDRRDLHRRRITQHPAGKRFLIPERSSAAFTRIRANAGVNALEQKVQGIQQDRNSAAMVSGTSVSSSTILF